MVCDPLSDSSFSPPSPSGIGGFAIPLPDLNIPFPAISMPDLTQLFNEITLILPPGTLRPNFEPDFANDVYAGINDILSKFTPFLMAYKFFLPVLNLILCIIEILCALMNPFKVFRAIRRLFRECIPEFLAIFPFFALPIMIISLLLLILSLIEYLVNRILQMILIIIDNIILLGKAAQRLDNDSIINIIKKVGDLLCLLQNLFVILGVILILIQIIKTLLSLIFKIPPCDSTDGSNDGCCTTDVCPDFIKNNNTITSNTGFLQYYNQVAIDSGLSLPPSFGPLISVVRQESWQFYDPNLSIRQAFINITRAYDLPVGFVKVFFPAGVSYNTTTSPSSVPYTIDFRFFYNPTIFGVSDPKGARFIKAVNVIVQNPPTAGVITFDGYTLIGPLNGTLNLVGGVMTEDDGTPILNTQGMTIPLNTFIHQSPTLTGITHPTDGILFQDLTYTFTINHEILFGENLITLGCVPDVAIDKNFINTTIGAQFNINGTKLGNVSNLLPDITATQNCVIGAITTFRQNLSVDSANAFQTNILNCLNGLSQQTSTALTAATAAGFDQYKSSFSVNPSIQFTTLPIEVSVSINESSGQLITSNLPASVASQLASQLSANITLGSISPFTYDGYNFFVANITSSIPGNGNVQVAFDNNFISTLSNPTSIDQPGSVAVNSLQYTFVQSSVISTGFDIRRDDGDIARSGSTESDGG